MVLPVTGSVRASSLLPTRYIHAIKVSRVKIRAFGIVHPSDFVSCLWCLGTRLYPLVEVCPYCGHLSIELSTLFGRAIEDVLVHAEDCLVDPRVDLVELDNMYERFDVRPFALGWVTRLLVCECPELSSGTWKL